MSNIFTPGPTPNTVRASDGRILTAPDGWALLPPGDAALTRRVKEAGDHWIVQEKKGRKVFSRGVWAPAATIDRIRVELEAERCTESYAKRKETDARRRDKAQVEYVEDFHGAVLAFLAFHPMYADLADRLARAGTDHSTPVGSGTVARTKRIPIERRAEAAVIALLRHQTTAYNTMTSPRVKGKRREVAGARRMPVQNGDGWSGRSIVRKWCGHLEGEARLNMNWYKPLALLIVCGAIVSPTSAQDKPVVGLIPKAQKPITMDGKLDDWASAFVTPVHVGHPDFANRGGQFLFLWDEQNLYVGLRCLDQKPAHIGPDNQIWNGDAVEFYLDTRRGEKLGAKEFGPGTLHCFYTPFTQTEIKPRIQVRDLPAFKGFKLQGAEVAAEKTPWGYTAEFKLPWSNFPEFKAKAGELIGIDCELCSSDGRQRVDRTFVYSGPAAVGSPSAFGRVKLVDRIEADDLKPLSRALLPLSLTRSTNYAWLYGTVCVSPTIAGSVAKLEGKLLDADGKVRKTSAGSKTSQEGFLLWTGSWELFDLPPGVYTLELVATDKTGGVITSRTEKVLHGNPIK